MFNDRDYLGRAGTAHRPGPRQAVVGPAVPARRLSQPRADSPACRRSARDLEDAETALEEKETDRAAQLIASVLTNEYAPDAVREAALSHQKKIAAGASLPKVQGAIASAPAALPPAAPKGFTPDDSARAKMLSDQAAEAVRGGKLEEAERLYQAALEAVPGYPEAHEGLRELASRQEVMSGTPRKP